MNHTLTLIFLLLIVGCVPIAQQKIDNENARLLNYEPLYLTIDSVKFIQTLNPAMSDEELTIRNREFHGNLGMKENFQSRYSITNYGVLYAGRGIRTDEVGYYEPIELLQDYLVFTIEFGAGVDFKGLVDYELIWNGYYYLTDDIPTVDLVFSFKDLDMRRAHITRSVRFNIAKLKTSVTSKIYIRFMGYDKLLEYNY